MAVHRKYSELTCLIVPSQSFQEVSVSFRRCSRCLFSADTQWCYRFLKCGRVQKRQSCKWHQLRFLSTGEFFNSWVQRLVKLSNGDSMWSKDMNYHHYGGAIWKASLSFLRQEKGPSEDHSILPDCQCEQKTTHFDKNINQLPTHFDRVEQIIIQLHIGTVITVEHYVTFKLQVTQEVLVKRFISRPTQIPKLLFKQAQLFSNGTL